MMEWGMCVGGGMFEALSPVSYIQLYTGVSQPGGRPSVLRTSTSEFEQLYLSRRPQMAKGASKSESVLERLDSLTLGKN